jgi:hypothetical protein
MLVAHMVPEALVPNVNTQTILTRLYSMARRADSRNVACLDCTGRSVATDHVALNACIGGLPLAVVAHTAIT